jgi:hypothetical protein
MLIPNILVRADSPWVRQCIPLGLSPKGLAFFQGLSTASRQRQAEIEAADDLDFDAFLARYLAGGQVNNQRTSPAILILGVTLFSAPGEVDRSFSA